MSNDPNQADHYVECPQHEDYEWGDHEEGCDIYIEYPVGEEYCSCGYEPLENECYCDDIKRRDDYDAECERYDV